MITIRDATKEDAPAILSIYEPYVQNTCITFEYDVPSLKEMETRICTTLKQYPYLVALEANTVVAYAYASAFHERKAYQWSVEGSIYVDPTRQRKGLGSLLYGALEKRLVECGYQNLFAVIAYPDEGSISFHEKNGFHEVGHYHRSGYKLERWMDTIIMQKELRQDDPPQALKAYEDVDPVWIQMEK